VSPDAVGGSCRLLTDYLETAAQKYPDKVAFTDGAGSALTFSSLRNAARSIGSALAARYCREPIAVLMERGPAMIAAFFGVLYAGCFYVPMDLEMSNYRISSILKSVRPRAAIVSGGGELIQQAAAGCDIFSYDDISAAPVDEALLSQTHARAMDVDLAYLVYTSGSTGTPKGIAASHRNVLDYVDNLASILRADTSTIFGSQTPLYVDASLKEVYTTLKAGATTVIIPKRLFSTPIKLVEFLNDHRVNTICWVVSALTMISGFGTLEKLKPQYLKTIAFGSEIFHLAQFKRWRDALPDARFINLYGPTETTGMCCYYEVTDEPVSAIPIGKPFPNTEVMLVADGHIVHTPGIEGEIYIRGTRVAAGYYRDPERTREAFVQNPAQNDYPETVYRAGDIAKYDGSGNLIFVSRRDHQIKHMGYRIELSEIEAFTSEIAGVADVCCVYDKARDRITLYYTGTAEERAVFTVFRSDMPRYTIPAKIHRIETMPYTTNGKIDRAALDEQAKES
jgi:amino acid adenylation domain-containing protein